MSTEEDVEKGGPLGADAPTENFDESMVTMLNSGISILESSENEYINYNVNPHDASKEDDSDSDANETGDNFSLEQSFKSSPVPPRHNQVSPAPPNGTTKRSKHATTIQLVDVKRLEAMSNRIVILDEIIEFIHHWWQKGYLKAFTIWLLWMMTGTIFYSIRNELGWSKGFYMMVNVGYSIGWGFPRELDNQCIWFSIVNVLVGATALSLALKVFAESIVSQSREWYAHALYEKRMSDNAVPWTVKFIEWSKTNQSKLTCISIFVVWILAMVTWGTTAYKEWRFVHGLYFAVSSLSTGGMFPIPQDSRHEQYVIAGVFAVFGVPLMGLAMGNLSSLLVSFGDPLQAKNKIKARVTREELDMMTEFGIHNNNGSVDRAAFILLCAVRIGALNPALIEEINKRFAALDTSNTGVLSHQDILQTHKRKSVVVMAKTDSKKSFFFPN